MQNITDDTDSFDHQDQEKYPIHFDNITEEKSVWDNFDTQFESNSKFIKKINLLSFFNN